MLLHARMKRAALAVTILAASSGVASAGTYLGLGLGTAPAIDNQLEMDSEGRSVRGLVGHRFGRLAIEGALGNFDGLAMQGAPYDAYQAQIAAKLSLPLGDGFEAFGRAGLQRTWLSRHKAELDADGNGYVLGAGFAYRLDIGVADGSIFVDYQYTNAELDDGLMRTFDYNTRMWTLGLTIGI